MLLGRANWNGAARTSAEERKETDTQGEKKRDIPREHSFHNCRACHDERPRAAHWTQAVTPSSPRGTASSGGSSLSAGTFCRMVRGLSPGALWLDRSAATGRALPAVPLRSEMLRRARRGVRRRGLSLKALFVQDEVGRWPPGRRRDDNARCKHMLSQLQRCDSY
jgi:hypothetical protein